MDCKVLVLILAFSVNVYWSDGNNPPRLWYRNMERGLVKMDDDNDHIPDESGHTNALKDLSTMVRKDPRDLGTNVHI